MDKTSHGTPSKISLCFWTTLNTQHSLIIRTKQIMLANYQPCVCVYGYSIHNHARTHTHTQKKKKKKK